jgi:competence protein ComEA
MNFSHLLKHIKSSELFSRTKPLQKFVKHNPSFTFAGSLFVIGTLTFCYGFYSLSHVQKVEALEIPKKVFETVSEPKAEVPEKVIVDIAGAVVKPGVYEMGKGERLSHLIEKAGGFEKTAHQAYVSKVFNLSEKVKDESKYYIPFKNEKIDVSSSVTSQKASSTSSQQSGLININTGSQKDFESLPGIGAVRAQNIISSRPYAKKNDLLDKGVVTQKIFSEIEKLITI